jgi:hypothetical protein
MDLSALVLPGTQQLLAAMMGDAWSTARDAIARRLGRDGRAEAAQAATALDASRTRVLAAHADGRDDLTLAYCAGYLEGLLAGRPDLDLAQLLEALPGTRAEEGPQQVGNYNSGTVGKLLQVDGDIHGGVRF